MKIRFNVKVERKLIAPEQAHDELKRRHRREDFIWTLKVFGLMLLVLGIGLIPAVRSQTLAPKLVIMLVMLVPAVLVFLRIAAARREAAGPAGMTASAAYGWRLKAGCWFLFFVALQAALWTAANDTRGMWTPWVWSGSAPALTAGIVLAFRWYRRLPQRWRNLTVAVGLLGTVFLGAVLSTWYNVAGSADGGSVEMLPVQEVRTHAGKHGDWYTLLLRVPELARYPVSIRISGDEYLRLQELRARKQIPFYELHVHEGALGRRWASDGHLVAYDAAN